MSNVKDVVILLSVIACLALTGFVISAFTAGLMFGVSGAVIVWGIWSTPRSIQRIKRTVSKSLVKRGF